MRVRAGVVALVGVAVLLVSAPARAASCSITTTPVSFGTYNVFSSAPVESTGTIVYRCNGSAKNVTIAISRGQGTFSARALKKGSESLIYNLFLNAARSVIWGDGSGGTTVHVNNNPPNNTDNTVPIYGRIPPAQDISAGAYADTVSVTINF